MDILFKDKIGFLEEIKKVMSGGHILGVFSECDRIYAENILKELVRDYRISKKIFASNVENTLDVVNDIIDIEDDIRLIIVFGGRNLIECAKVASTLMGNSLVIILTTPLRVIEDESLLFEGNILKKRRVVAPKIILGEERYLLKRGGFFAPLGSISVSIVDAINNIYNEIIKQRKQIQSGDLRNLVSICDKLSENNEMEILRSSYKLDCKKYNLISYIADNLCYHSKTGENYSNYEFALTYAILLLYRGYANYTGDDLLFPPDIVESAKKLNEKYNYDISKLILDFKVMTSSEFMRNKHILNEYRDEVLTAINCGITIMDSMSKVYRRVSKDAGFNLYRETSLDDILESISIFSVCESENTLLTNMKQCGILERYIRG